MSINEMGIMYLSVYDLKLECTGKLAIYGLVFSRLLQECDQWTVVSCHGNKETAHCVLSSSLC